MNDPLKTSIRKFATDAVAQQAARVVEPSGDNIVKVPLDKLRKSPYQPRLRALRKADVADLMASLNSVGLTTPIVVAPDPDEKGCFHVHQGERRWFSVHQLGWTEIDAIVRVGLSATDARKMAVADNLCRDDLTAFEQAKALADYHTASGLQYELAAQQLGVSRATAYRLKNILGCSERLQEVFQEAGISVTVAALLAKLETQDSRAAFRMAQGYRDGSIGSVAIEDAIAANRAKPARSTPAKRDVEIKASEHGVELRISWREGRSTDENKTRIVMALGEVLQRLNVQVADAAKLWQQADA